MSPPDAVGQTVQEDVRAVAHQSALGGGAPVQTPVAMTDLSACEVGSVYAPSLAEWGVLSANARAVGDAPLGGMSKRILDLVIAVSALTVALPLMALIALAIWATTGGSPVYRHLRVGYGNRLFPCYKFRTMVTDADVQLARILATDPAAAEEWASRRKLRHDPRVKPLGRMLRNTSLDELPQLFNVLKGHMSCVGPRPVTREELAYYEAEAALYFTARPGVTGPWQVYGRSSLDFSERVTIDGHYLRNQSLWGDLLILIKTPAAVLRMKQVC